MGLNSAAASGLGALTGATPSPAMSPTSADNNSVLARLLREHPELATRMKKGGTASARADGCCIKGKTKGRIV